MLKRKKNQHRHNYRNGCALHWTHRTRRQKIAATNSMMMINNVAQPKMEFVSCTCFTRKYFKFFVDTSVLYIVLCAVSLNLIFYRCMCTLWAMFNVHVHFANGWSLTANWEHSNRKTLRNNDGINKQSVFQFLNIKLYNHRAGEISESCFSVIQSSKKVEREKNMCTSFVEWFFARCRKNPKQGHNLGGTWK